MRLLRSAAACQLARTATAAETALLIETEAACRAAMRPATAAEIAAHIEALALHFPTLRRNDAEHRIAARHWLDDFAGWPADLVAEACRLWRNGDHERFPSAGQLKAAAAPVLAHRDMLARRAARFLDLRHEPRLEDTPR